MTTDLVNGIPNSITLPLCAMALLLGPAIINGLERVLGELWDWIRR